MKTQRIIVHGRVQGVGYRASFAEQARRLGLRGWVRNRRDGTVEAVVQGDDQGVEAVFTWAQRGPSFSEVESVDISEASGDFGDFEIAATL